MNAPQPETLEEALALAAAIRATVGVQRWAWSEKFVKEAWWEATFQRAVDDDWEHRWTDEQCASIAVTYRLTK